MADNYRSYNSSDLQQILNVAMSAEKKFSDALNATIAARDTLRTVSTAGGNLSGGGTEATFSRICNTCLQFNELHNEMKDFIKRIDEAKQEMDKDDQRIEKIKDSVEVDSWKNGNSYSQDAADKDLLDKLEELTDTPGAWDNMKEYASSKYSEKYASGEVGSAELLLGNTGIVLGGFGGQLIDGALNAGKIFGIKYDVLPPSFTYQAAEKTGELMGFIGRGIDREISSKVNTWNTWKNYITGDSTSDRGTPQEGRSF